MVIEIPELLTKEEVAEARAALLAAEWVDGRATAGHRAQTVKRNAQLAPENPLAQKLSQLILDRLARTPLFIAATLPLRILPPKFNRYEGGGTYGNHVDNAIFPIPGTAQHVRSDISSTLFFSDPDDYDGGELVIEDMFGEHRVKLPAGHLIVYPGSSLHRVTPVTRGARLAAFFWTQSLVASDERRRTLFQLDNAIRSLSADHPDHASVDELTNVYHNLLRQWSTT